MKIEVVFIDGNKEIIENVETAYYDQDSKCFLVNDGLSTIWYPRERVLSFVKKY